MGKKIRDSRGFTLIAALLLTLLLSAMAVGLLYLVNNEQRMGTNDLEGNTAYYGAEAGIENLTAQLSTLYQQSQSPNATAICALTGPTYYPTAISGSNIGSMNYTVSVSWPPNNICPTLTNPTGSWDIVGSGNNQGMVATLIPFNLQVTAQRQSSAGQVGTNVLAATGAAVNLTRTVEVALLPAFEFGVFCDGDCDYFAGPNFNFGGRVHTNGNLYLASGSNLTFTDRITVFGNIVTDRLENGWPTNNGYTGNVWVPAASAACPNAPGTGPVPPNCNALPSGSWAGGIPTSPPGPPTNPAGTGAAVGNWNLISHDKPTDPTPGFASFILSGSTGATKLQLPFVNSNNVGAIEIIRRPQPTDSALLTTSRLYSEASIRILLADTLADLHPDRGAAALDADDVQLGISPTALGGPTASAQFNYNGSPANAFMYFGVANTVGGNGWVAPTNPATGTNYQWTSWPLLGQITSIPLNAVGAAPNVPGQNIPYVWLRVEYLNNVTSAWTGVTRQWLGYGFGRTYDMPPTAPWGAAACTLYPAFPAGQCSNPISPAILILQQLQPGAVAATDGFGAGGPSANNWIPINFYDAREGEPRDNGAARTSNTTNNPGQVVYTPCGAGGVMNAVELDAGNLWLWLQKVGPYTGGSGALVNSIAQNGYILYFSDRRGMIADPNLTSVGLYNRITGMSGLEDTINAASVPGVPDNKLEVASYYGISPEDVNGDNFLDNWGQRYLGAGFGQTAPPFAVNNNMAQPYSPVPANLPTSNPFASQQVSCNSYKYIAAGNIETYPAGTGNLGGTVPAGNPQNNMVTGPRHALRLVDGGMNAAAVSYLPHPAPGNTGNGFTIASEEPVYVFGDYNSGSADPLFKAPSNGTTPHSAAAIIADSVTLLSNPPSAATQPTANVGWTDAQSFLQPGDVGNRPGNTTYYRMAIAAGKSMPFPLPGWANGLSLKDFGTDGGMHNFLRYLELRGAGGAIVHYSGSLISMYYSQYHTGVFKCCNVVYGAPTRDYFFDTQFLNPANLPPGTPMFQDVVSLSFHQSFTPQ